MIQTLVTGSTLLFNHGGILKAMPNLLQRKPIPRDSYLPCPQHRECQCHNDTDIPPRFLWEGQESPNIRPLQCVPFHLPSSSPAMESGEAAWPARWLDNAGSWYAGTQSLESNGRLASATGHLPPESGWEHLPTVAC